MLQGGLPWEDDIDMYSDKCRVVRDKKLKFNQSKAFKLSPKEIQDYMNYVTSLDYKAKPDYNKLLKLVEDLAKRERIDLDDKIFDWNIIRASR